MTDQRLISDAKRRARLLSRQTGRSYQSHLEEISREAGRGGWSAFLLDPAPFPMTGGEATEDAPRRGRRSRRALTLEEWIPIFLAYGNRSTFLGLALTTVPLLLLSFPISGIPILNDYGMAWMAFLLGTTLVGMFLMYSPWAMKTAYLLMLTGFWLAGTIRGHMAGRQLLHLWARTAVPMALVTVFLYLFIDVGPSVLMPIPMDMVEAIASDAATARTIQIVGESTPNRLSSYRRHGPTTDLDIVIVDERVASRFMRGTHITQKLGGRAIATSMPDHPVYRWNGRLDCRTGRFHPAVAETADTVAGPAVARAPLALKTDKGMLLSTKDLSTLCGSVAGS